MSEEEVKIEFRDKRRIKSVDDTCDDAVEADLDRIPSVVKKLQGEVSQHDERLKEYISAHKEKMAEMDKVRIRLEGQVEQRAKGMFCDIVKNILPVIDDFDRAISAASTTHQGDSLYEGVCMLRESLMKVLTSQGLEVIDCRDKPFDPEIAQAVSAVSVDDDDKVDVVVEQLSAGYMFEGRVLRPAMVRVGQKTSKV